MGLPQFPNGRCSLLLESPVNFTIVTGASKNHWCPLQAFLLTLNKTLKSLPEKIKPEIVVYDLGLSSAQRQELNQLRVEEGLFDELATFNYTKYPSFWNLKVNRGEYAWKAGIIHEVSKTHPGIILWMDSGDRVLPNFLANIVHFIKRNGFYSPTSSGDVRKWTHPGLFQYFHDDMEKYAEEPNCNGAFIGLDSDNRQVRESILEPFMSCALDKDCIAPEGSSRINHRQDQAVLTYLVLKNKFRCTDEGLAGLMIHKDGDCKSQIEDHRRQLGS
ncbi:hypothetical protein K493DRAFT_229915 [Basidiobolus meristosporus CBS 931.73]|uniref:Uncharacterized protein n=1 Tax=Basidiobolus meristosporus CBS 931.73 TaxID=1314790 RepID=A0A1Y1XY70_9FUNG|nr:hypothetical protein K493DRAFT_229915 [Basidiobolus meristosporus CBS 931.73]|eukprot:ORX90698.1 hypothetical protein K493DRAFT_229915 [Basidiobolus meristosporus CBS 931.73]